MAVGDPVHLGVLLLLLRLNLGDVFPVSFPFIFDDLSMRTALSKAKMCPLTVAVMVAHDPSRPPYLEQEIPSPVWHLIHYGMNWLATTKQLNSVVPGEDVFIAGYPGLGKLGFERPLLVSGIVSSDPRYPATFVDETLPSSVLCHSFSWGGMSGAPVVGISSAIGESKLFGVNAGHIASQGVVA